MKNLNKYIFEIILFAIAVVLLILKTQPFGIVLPLAVGMFTLSVIVILFFIFIFFIWGEKAEDERDEHNKYKISRYAYLFGTSSLILAIIYQDLTVHMVDGWLIFALSVMVFTKIFGKIYIKLKE